MRMHMYWLTKKCYPVYVVILSTWLSHLLYFIWNSCVGEMLCCESGHRHNLHDQLAVSVKKYDVTVGHIFQKVSHMCTLFIRQGLPVAMRTWWKIPHF